MNRSLLVGMIIAGISLQQCRSARDVQMTAPPVPSGMTGLEAVCPALDTIRTVLISRAEAVLHFDNERYEVSLTLFSKKDSIIYLSAVSSGFEILRASVEQDTIRVIDRLNRIVYRTPLLKKFGYQHPISFDDLQNLVSRYYLCDDMSLATDNFSSTIQFEFDVPNIKKRISLDREKIILNRFEFYHSKTNEYLMGERTQDGMKIYSNIMISDFEIIGSGGAISYNQEIRVRMEVNPQRYSFIDLQ